MFQMAGLDLPDFLKKDKVEEGSAKVVESKPQPKANPKAQSNPKPKDGGSSKTPPTGDNK